MKTIAFIVGVLALPMLGIVMAANPVATQEEKREATKNDAASFSPYVDGNGQIRLPPDYKTAWTHLGDWAVAKKEGEDDGERAGREGAALTVL